MTLQFLGETDKLDEIRGALQQVKGAAVPMAFRGTGFFPNPKSPRVFWVGIESDEHLQELANSIGAALKPLGFERDAGPFKPHLTLARAGQWTAEAGSRRTVRAGTARGAGEGGKSRAGRVRYNDGARVLSLREQAVTEGRAVYEGGAIPADLRKCGAG